MMTRTDGISLISASSMRSQMTWLSPTVMFGIDHEVELDEGRAAGDAGLEVVHLDRALGIGRDDVADVHVLLDVDGAVHQPAERLADDAPALVEDVDRHDDGEQRIEQVPAGGDRRREADDDADRGDRRRS